jgi:CheY-like chemotaxis protein
MKRLQIMVVEDDAMIAFLLGEILRGMGHDVCASEATEDEAIAAALGCKPDLMIVDEHLGHGSGLNVVDAVLGHGPVPHVFVSGDARTIRKRRPDAVIVDKPYSEADLARAIRKAMNPASAPAPRAAGHSLSPLADDGGPKGRTRGLALIGGAFEGLRQALVGK